MSHVDIYWLTLQDTQSHFPTVFSCGKQYMYPSETPGLSISREFKRFLISVTEKVSSCVRSCDKPPGRIVTWPFPHPSVHCNGGWTMAVDELPTVYALYVSTTKCLSQVWTSWVRKSLRSEVWHLRSHCGNCKLQAFQKCIGMYLIDIWSMYCFTARRPGGQCKIVHSPMCDMCHTPHSELYYFALTVLIQDCWTS